MQFSVCVEGIVSLTLKPVRNIMTSIGSVSFSPKVEMPQEVSVDI